MAVDDMGKLQGNKLFELLSKQFSVRELDMFFLQNKRTLVLAIKVTWKKISVSRVYQFLNYYFFCSNFSEVFFLFYL